MRLHARLTCTWDDEACVWFVNQSNIPGLAAEATTLQALRLKLPGMIRDLLDIDPLDHEVGLIS
ncbi:DUF1902 domain-containing protein [Methylobacterium sp. WL9]|uniref:DUF1902 domain-containing protein n=2 Tax=Methylobacterium TaxID=407 RepID=UPI0011C9D151|nr:DUF1902 domain-containing protein [Methylobacterium sp. WL9]TXN24343.1 DUF1902 domain-containing protein [Methylobacterium sp. WL9]